MEYFLLSPRPTIWCITPMRGCCSFGWQCCTQADIRTETLCNFLLLHREAKRVGNQAKYKHIANTGECSPNETSRTVVYIYESSGKACIIKVGLRSGTQRNIFFSHSFPRIQRSGRVWEREGVVVWGKWKGDRVSEKNSKMNGGWGQTKNVDCRLFSCRFIFLWWVVIDKFISSKTFHGGTKHYIKINIRGIKDRSVRTAAFRKKSSVAGMETNKSSSESRSMKFCWCHLIICWRSKLESTKHYAHFPKFHTTPKDPALEEVPQIGPIMY